MISDMKVLIGLHRTVKRIDLESAKICAKYGLSMSQFAVLEALYHKGDMSVGQVQKKILSSSGTIPLIIRNLEKRKYLIRTVDANDKRRCNLHISEQGVQLIRLVYPRNEACIIAMMQCWSSEEKEQMITLLRKFRGTHDEANN